ncbi:MAG: hypothetical protein RXO54_07885 [Acidilobus sp.]
MSEAKAEEVKAEEAQGQAQQVKEEAKAEQASQQQEAQAAQTEATQVAQQEAQAQQQQEEAKVEVKEEVKAEETKEEVKVEVKAEAPKPNEDVIKELDALARLLLWASKNRGRVFQVAKEINKNKEKLINTFAEALDPNIYEFVVQAMSKFGLVQYEKLPKPRECPECRQSKEELEETLKQVIELFNNSSEIPPEKKPIAIEKAKKVYSLDYDTRIEYLKTVLQKTTEIAERNPMEGLMAFLKWLTRDTDPGAYDGVLMYPFMARPQYRDAWVKVVVAFIAFVDKFISSFMT